MGSASSSATSNQTMNTNIVNRSSLNLLNKSINNFTNNTVMSNAKSCSSGISQLQNITFDGITTRGDFDVSNVSQKQSAALTFSCINKTTLKNDIGNGVLAEYMNAIKNSFSTQAVAEMANQASATAQQQAFSMGSADANTTTNNNYNFNQTTQIDQNIQNVVENAINNNFSMEDVQSCIGNVNANQNMSFKNINVGGNANIKALSQDQATTVMQECIQSSDSANKTTNAAATALGLQVTTEGSTVTDVTMTSKATALAESLGLSLGNLSAYSSVCIICIVVIVLVFVFMKFSSSDIQNMAQSYKK